MANETKKDCQKSLHRSRKKKLNSYCLHSMSNSWHCPVQFSSWRFLSIEQFRSSIDDHQLMLDDSFGHLHWLETLLDPLTQSWNKFQKYNVNIIFRILPWLVGNFWLENDVNDLHDIRWMLIRISFEVILHFFEIEFVDFLERNFAISRFLLTCALNLGLKMN